MTEGEWLAASDPAAMVQCDLVRPQARKVRLCGIGCCRQLGITNPRQLKALDAAERYADGLLKDRGLDNWTLQMNRHWQALERDRRPLRDRAPEIAVCRAVAYSCTTNRTGSYRMVVHWLSVPYCGLLPAAILDLRPTLVHVVRDVFGNPFRPVAFEPAWRTTTAVQLARQMYESRDFSAMPILADVLQDAGCDNEDVLAHCRGEGPHVRGCWVVDLVLGKA